MKIKLEIRVYTNYEIRFYIQFVGWCFNMQEI